MPVLLGGEHSIPIGPALAFKEFTPNANYGKILVLNIVLLGIGGGLNPMP